MFGLKMQLLDVAKPNTWYRNQNPKTAQTWLRWLSGSFATTLCIHDTSHTNFAYSATPELCSVLPQTNRNSRQSVHGQN